MINATSVFLERWADISGTPEAREPYAAEQTAVGRPSFTSRELANGLVPGII